MVWMTELENKKKSVHSLALSALVEHYFPKLKSISEEKEILPTSVHLKVPQILCIIQDNDLINVCMQDPTASKTIDVFVKRLWELIHSRDSAAMWTGFVLLDETLRYCSHEKLSTHFETWAKDFEDALTLKKKVDRGSSYPRGLSAWCTLIARASEWADLKRSCSTHVPSITAALLLPLSIDSEFSDETKVACLQYLCTLVDSMNSSVKPQVAKIESTCLPLLLHHNHEIRTAACRLFANIPKCFTASSMQFTPFLEKTIEHAHMFLDVVFDGLEGALRKHSTQALPHHSVLPGIRGMSIERLLDGFKGMCKCVESMVTTKVSYPCDLPLEAILKLIMRVFTVNYGMSNVSTPSDVDPLRPAERLALIPLTHIVTLELLDSIIVQLKRHLLPHSRTIIRIITQVHTRTLTRTATAQKLAYVALAHTMEFVCGAGVWGKEGAGGGGMIEDALFSKLLADTAPPRQVTQKSILDVKLAGKSRHNNNSGGKKKKKKKGGANGSEDGGDNLVTSDVTRKALKALHAILFHTGPHIPPIQRSKIDQTIITHLLSVTSDRTLKASSAYKVALYKCLTASVIRPTPSSPPILVFALRLFCSGLSDQCYKVVRICKEGAAICENQVHPYVPTLPSHFLLPSQPSNPITSTDQTPSIHSPVNSEEIPDRKRKEREEEQEKEDERKRTEERELEEKQQKEERKRKRVEHQQAEARMLDEQPKDKLEEAVDDTLPESVQTVLEEIGDDDKNVPQLVQYQSTPISFASKLSTEVLEDDIDILDAPPDSDEDLSDLE